MGKASAKPLTKRVLTLGPATDALSIGEVFRLLDLADGVRINLAHATPGEVEARVRSVRGYEAERGRPLALVVDLRGPSVRVGKTPPISVERGQEVVFKPGRESDGSFIPVPELFFAVVEPGDVVLMLDGKLRMRVVSAGPGAARALAESSGVVESGKAVVVEGKDFDLPSPTDDDVEALRRIAHLAPEVDYVSVSLARGCGDVEKARAVLRELGFESQVAVKIETRRAVESLEELAQCGDYLVVARGDLGLHYGLEALPVVQRRVVYTALRLGKPVAVATQLLDSLQSYPTPTRAEVNDVFTTASMGVDSVWLTNETASGRYPIEATSWLTKILNAVEYHVPQRPVPNGVRDRFAKALVELAEDLGADILVYSMSGALARRVAKFRPLRPVYVGTPSIKTARALSVVWALEPLHIPAPSYEEGLAKLIAMRGKAPYVATYGIRGGEHVIKLFIEED